MANIKIPTKLLLSLNRRRNFTRLLSDEAIKRNWSTKSNESPEAVKFQTNRVLTVPNILTFSRMATAPAMGYFIWNGMNSQALVCFAYAAVTDLLDGWIARKFNQNSDVGAILDPIADKLLLTTCFVAMYNVSMLPLWAVKIFLLKDIVLLGGGATIRYCHFDDTPGLKKFLDLKNHPTIGFEPTYLSKCNTALQCLLILTHLTTNQMAGTSPYDGYMFGFHLLVCASTSGTFYQYLHKFIKPSFFSKPPKSNC